MVFPIPMQAIMEQRTGTSLCLLFRLVYEAHTIVFKVICTSFIIRHRNKHQESFALALFRDSNYIIQYARVMVLPA